MGPLDLVASLAWAGVAFYALHRLAPSLARWLDGRTPAVEADPDIPPDLLAFIANFSSDWARKDARKAILERYEQHRDWNAVRRAVGVGVME